MDRSITANGTLEEIYAHGIKALTEESVHDGLIAQYEDGVDHLWSTIPTKFKETFKDDWDKVEKLEGKKNRERFLKKMQIISDTLADLKWLYKDSQGPIKNLLDDMEDVDNYE